MMAIGGDSSWTQFRVGPNKNDPSCAILSRVSHIAHFESARRMSPTEQSTPALCMMSQN